MRGVVALLTLPFDGALLRGRLLRRHELTRRLHTASQQLRELEVTRNQEGYFVDREIGRLLHTTGLPQPLQVLADKYQQLESLSRETHTKTVAVHDGFSYGWCSQDYEEVVKVPSAYEQAEKERLGLHKTFVKELVATASGMDITFAKR